MEMRLETFLVSQVTSVLHLLRQLLRDLFQAWHGQFVRGTQVLLVQFFVVFHVGNPVITILFTAKTSAIRATVTLHAEYNNFGAALPSQPSVAV
jgi:hypothetical protein